MHLVLIPGLLLAMTTSALFSIPAQRAEDLPNGDLRGAGLFFSITAQAPSTATLTTTVSTNATVTVTSSGVATSGVVATETITGSVQNTPAPLPQPGGSIPLKSNPFDPGFLFSAPSPPVGPYAWAFLALMLALLAASAYFMLIKRVEWKRTNPVLYRAANRWGQVGLWIAIPGLLFLLFRVIALDFFNMRFWLYLWTLAPLAAAAWFFYWLRTKYPQEAAKYQKSQRARQYMPGAASKSSVRQAAQTKSKAIAAPMASDATATSTIATSEAATQSPGTRHKAGQKSNKRGKRR